MSKLPNNLLLALILLLSMASVAMSRSTGLQASNAAQFYNEELKYQRAGQLERAVQAYRIAIQLNPQFAIAYANLGATYLQLQRYEEAVKILEQGVRLRPPEAWVMYENLGRAYHALGRYNESAEASSESIRLNPKQVLNYLIRGTTYLRTGQYGRAAQDFNEGIRLGGKQPNIYRIRSLTHLIMGRGDSAAEDAKTYLGLKGWREQTSPYIALWAHFGYRQSRRDADARGVLEEAMNRGGTSTWPYPVIKYLRREITEQDLLALATDTDKMTEARAYVGMDLSLAGRRDEALAHLRWVKDNGNKDFTEYLLAVAEIGRIENSVAGASQEGR